MDTYFIPVTQCSVCKSTKRHPILDTSFKARELSWHFQLVQCEECTLVYLDQAPTPEAFDLIYPSETYYSYDSHSTSLRSRVKTWVMSGETSPDERLNSIGARTRRTIARVLASQLMTLPKGSGGRLLDVGCGAGDLLVQARQTAKWQVHGVEPSRVAVERARAQGLDVFCGELEQAQFPGAYFDMIVLSHLIEHVVDPVGLLQECCRILRPGGKLLVTTPNFACFDRVSFGRYWKNLLVPQHLCFFTPHTLDGAIRSAGLQTMSRQFALLPKKKHDLAAFSFRFLWQDRQVIGMKETASLIARACLRTFVVKPCLYLLHASPEQIGDTMSFVVTNNP